LRPPASGFPRQPTPAFNWNVVYNAHIVKRKSKHIQKNLALFVGWFRLNAAESGLTF